MIGRRSCALFVFSVKILVLVSCRLVSLAILVDIYHQPHYLFPISRHAVTHCMCDTHIFHCSSALSEKS